MLHRALFYLSALLETRRDSRNNARPADTDRQTLISKTSNSCSVCKSEMWRKKLMNHLFIWPRIHRIVLINLWSSWQIICYVTTQDARDIVRMLRKPIPVSSSKKKLGNLWNQCSLVSLVGAVWDDDYPSSLPLLSDCCWLDDWWRNIDLRMGRRKFVCLMLWSGFLSPHPRL